MNDAAIGAPVGSDDMKAGILAAYKHIESVQVRETLIDTMSDEEWLSDDPDSWKIEVGSSHCEDEVDSIDADAIVAA